MSTAIAVPSIAAAAPTRKANYARAFAGLFLRDLYVLRRELGTFLIRVVMNPLLFLFVFTYIMPHMVGWRGDEPHGTNVRCRCGHQLFYRPGPPA